MTKTLKTRRHIPRRGFASTPIQSPKVIARDISRSSSHLGENTASTVDNLRALWDKDYPFRTCPYFTEEEMYERTDWNCVRIDETIQVINSKHTVQELLFMAKCREWVLKVMRHEDGQVDWDFAVFNGGRSCFHPDEARNQILTHHSQEVYDRWRRHVRASFDDAAPKLLAACKEALPTLRAWSVTCGDSSERLVRSLDDVIVMNRIAYLIW